MTFVIDIDSVDKCHKTPLFRFERFFESVSMRKGSQQASFLIINNLLLFINIFIFN